MKAQETNFRPLIEGTKQYLIPLFQRPYSWDKKEWDVLWEDLHDLCLRETPRFHFIGSLVTMASNTTPEGFNKFLIIDGQQRLTTIIILLSVIRDLAVERELADLGNEITQTMILNPFKSGTDKLKLIPTQRDRDEFINLISNQIIGDTKISQAYTFFKTKINKSSIDLASLFKVITSRLSVVSIVLDTDDNPHLVFESLNAKGRPLTQSDLIRNYFFMKIPTSDQEFYYSHYWLPMEESLQDKLTEFFRHYLMRNGNQIKQGDVYYYLKEMVGDNPVIEELKELYEYSKYYKNIIAPENEEDELLQKILSRLLRLDISTTYPFLLNCYKQYKDNSISKENFLETLKVVENFIIRRFVCNKPTFELKGIFALLFYQISLQHTENLLEGVKNILQQKNYPRDEEFLNDIKNVTLYGNADRQAKGKLILETLEESYNHKEVVDLTNLTIEHVMPQTLTKWWEKQLGDDFALDHELFLHTVGNLTLTAYNQSLSNDSFPDKKSKYANSHLELNKYFSQISEWNRSNIEERAIYISQKMVSIWPYFGNATLRKIPTNAVTGKTPKNLFFQGEKFQVSTWRDVLTTTLKIIEEKEPEEFKKILKEYPRFINNNPKGFRSSKKFNDSLYIEVNLSAASIHRFCSQIIQIMGLSQADWYVEI